MAAEGRTALIVGASRGLGLGLAAGYANAGWRVVATTRGRGDEGLRRLAETQGDRVRIIEFDATDAGAIHHLASEGPFDLVFVSAGVMGSRDKTGAAETPEDFAHVMLTNARAPLAIIERLGEEMRADGIIVAMTSILGSVAQNTRGGTELYRASKAALNSLLRSYAARHPDRAIVAMHPGWVRTDMGGAHADLGVEESVAGMMRVIESRVGKPGCTFLDHQGQTIPW